MFLRSGAGLLHWLWTLIFLTHTQTHARTHTYTHTHTHTHSHAHTHTHNHTHTHTRAHTDRHRDALDDSNTHMQLLPYWTSLCQGLPSWVFLWVNRCFHHWKSLLSFPRAHTHAPDTHTYTHTHTC